MGPVVMCKKCEFQRAFYFQVQIRSADEPATTFYRYVCLFDPEVRKGADEE